MNRRMFFGALTLSTCLLGLVGLTTQAQAAFYGDFGTPGGFIVFRDVQDINGLYGAPSVVSNTLLFAPPISTSPAPTRSSAHPSQPASRTR